MKTLGMISSRKVIVFDPIPDVGHGPSEVESGRVWVDLY